MRFGVFPCFHFQFYNLLLTAQAEQAPNFPHLLLAAIQVQLFLNHFYIISMLAIPKMHLQVPHSVSNDLNPSKSTCPAFLRAHTKTPKNNPASQNNSLRSSASSILRSSTPVKSIGQKKLPRMFNSDLKSFRSERDLNANKSQTGKKMVQKHDSSQLSSQEGILSREQSQQIQIRIKETPLARLNQPPSQLNFFTETTLGKTKTPPLVQTINNSLGHSLYDLKRRVEARSHQGSPKGRQTGIRKLSFCVANRSRLKDFMFIKNIGRGGCAEVHLVKHIALGMLFAMKIISKSKIRAMNLEDMVFRQIKIHFHVKHENIVALYDVFSDSNNIYLVLEYLSEGSVHSEWRHKGEYSEQRTAEIITDVCRAVKKLHHCSIIHRDLKLENILQMCKVIKITDLGCSIYSNHMRNSQVGSPDYLSPEQLSHHFYDNKVDIWSIGVMTFELLFGQSPFSSQIHEILHQKNHHLFPKVQFPEGKQITSKAKQFIGQALQRDPDLRPSIDRLLAHEFLRTALAKSPAQVQH